MKIILGISAFYHDSAASIIIDGEVKIAIQEERFTRTKNTAEFPINSIKHCIKYLDLKIENIDAVVFYDKPLLKLERILTSFYSRAPIGLYTFAKIIPQFFNNKVFIKKIIRRTLKKEFNENMGDLNILFSDHHLSHAASAFYLSPFEKSAIVTIDGVGEWSTASISIGIKNKIKTLKQLNFPHSVGLFYSACTQYLGFKVNSGEYKLMGLAPYGDINSKETNGFIKILRSNIVRINDDGSINLNPIYFNYVSGLSMIKPKHWESKFGFKTRNNSSDQYLKHHCNFALAVQKVTEEIVLKIVAKARKITGLKNVCMAGGVSLNCSINQILIDSSPPNSVFIQPASGDCGGSIGAALAINYLYYDKERIVKSIENNDFNFMYLGPEYIKHQYTLNKFQNIQYKLFDDFELLCKFTSEKISEGKIFGWFQGRMEFGPRALGNRSIIADPRNPEMKRRINTIIKNRESFRPFAPAILEEYSNLYFEMKNPSPFMTTTVKFRTRVESESSIPFEKKFKAKLGPIPSVTHVDWSSRVQTVTKKSNKKFHTLISEFYNLTGVPILLNTSFNLNEEPIVCSPLDAYNCFRKSNLDYLVINNYIYWKV